MKTIPKKELSKFRATNREQCGILIEGDTFIRIVEVRNCHPNPESYAIKLSDMEMVKHSIKKNEAVIGFFHTHLAHQSPNPSDLDFDGARIYPAMLNVVYHPASGSLIWYGDHLTEVLQT